jgi:hypothetical protein
LLDGGEAPTNGHSGSGSVDPSLFLSVIGFRDWEKFLESTDPVLVGQWAFYYNCLTPEQRKAVGNWAGVVNKAVRAGQKPRLSGHQNAAFYTLWMQTQ